MAVLLPLIYAAICVAIFKILRVPLNKWTVATAGIGAVAVIGGLLAGMNYNHPFTTDARLCFFTTPIIPQVKGRVVEVPVRPNVALKNGSPLFKIDTLQRNLDAAALVSDCHPACALTHAAIASTRAVSLRGVWRS